MKVSICVLAFNHEEYLDDCLRGILEQVCDFEYQIVVGEDCSTDKTLQICNRYKYLYPKKIIIINNISNIGLLKNTVNTLKNCTGEYIALCDGDDYWIDRDKLQKQIDFLDENKNFSMHFHKAKILSSKPISYLSKFENIKSHNIHIRDIILHHYIPTSSLVFRANLLNETIYQAIEKSHVNDRPLEIMLSDSGPARYSDEIMSVYRINSGSFTNSSSHIKSANAGNLKMYKILNILTKRKFFLYFYILIIKEYLRILRSNFIKT